MTTTTKSLDILFRQAMEAPLSPEAEGCTRELLHSLTGSLLARRDLRHDPRAQNMLLACRLRLRALQNAVLCARTEDAFLPRPCELREYTADLCAAANLLLTPLGRCVRFTAPEEPMEALCTPRDYAALLLELLCNCALHCHGEEIVVALASKKRGHPCARRDSGAVLTLTVECRGALDLDALHAAGQRAGSGVAAMQKTAWLHHGALLWLERDGKAVAAFRLPGTKAGHPYSDTPDYVDLLSDPCSQVYASLAPAVGGIS